MHPSEVIKPFAGPSRGPLAFRVDPERCSACGLCAEDCPMGLITGEPPRVEPEQEARCMRCQHCMAVCPAGAISIEGLRVEESQPLVAGEGPTLEQVTRMVRDRRSVRRYQDRDVDPALIQRLLEDAAYAPTGANARALTFTVIDRKAHLATFRTQVYAALTQALKAESIPPRLSYLASAPAAFKDHGIDMIFRNAPHALIVSAPTSAPCGQTDVPIALAAFEYLAVTAGLGTVWWGLLHTVLEASPELKAHLDLPAEGVHYYGMLFGYPEGPYARGVQREGAALIKRVGGSR